MSSCLTRKKILVERAADFPCVQSSLNPPLKKSNTPSSECMAGDEVSLSGNLSEWSLAYNYGRITGLLRLWQMIEGDLINLQIDIKHLRVRAGTPPHIIKGLIKHLTHKIECRGCAQQSVDKWVFENFTPPQKKN